MDADPKSPLQEGRSSAFHAASCYASSCGRVTLYLGDCMDIMPTVRGQMVMTDPPFSAVTHNGARTRTTGAESNVLIDFDAMNGEDFLAASRAMLAASERWVVMFCDWRHAAMLEPAGLPLVRLGVWVKPNSAPQLTGDRPATGWESIAMLHPPTKKRWNGGGSRAVWTENRVDAVNHPTEKPVGLVGKLINLFTDDGDTVIDPYMGSGTTGIAAIRTNRRFVGIEKNPTHYATAMKRITDELAQGDLFLGHKDKRSNGND